MSMSALRVLAPGEPWRETRVERWIGFALLAAAVIAGAVLRWKLRDPAITSDEIALIHPIEWPRSGNFMDDARWFFRSVVSFFNNKEWARNPPLFPFLFALAGTPVGMVRSGRVFMALCGVAMPIPIFFAARRATGGQTIAGALASAILAMSPVLAYEGETLRLYGVWALIEASRLACFCAFVADEDRNVRRPWVWRGFVGLTCLLPWVHYASIPVLVVEALLCALLLRARRPKSP